MSQPKPNTMDDLSLAEFYRREKDELLELLANIVNGAVPMGDQEDGDFVGFYVLSTGQIHKAIPVLDRHKVDRYPATHKVKRFEAFMSAKIKGVELGLLNNLLASWEANEDIDDFIDILKFKRDRLASLKGGDV